jgi:ADP-ribose pyrophosphatase
MELWDLYDREGKKTGKTWEREFGNYKQIPEGYYHLVVDILVQHKDGTYLLTKRSMTKDVYPGFWEASAGGSAVTGEEPLEAAKRELYEETGLTAVSLELVSQTFRDPSHSMFYSYLAVVDADKDSVVLQEGETDEYKWVDKSEFLEYVESENSIKTHNNRYTDLIEKIREESNTENHLVSDTE